MLRVARDAYLEMLAHAYDGLPDEACGLLVGTEDGDGVASVPQFVPCRNLAASAQVYTLDPRDHLRADREAQAAGREIVGVVHSHTHTDPYPSPTDVAQAPDPSWHYVIISLRDTEPMLRSYRIVEGAIAEEPVVLT